MKPEYLSDIEAGRRFAVSRATLRRWARLDPTFPRPVKLSEGCTRWRVADLDAWAIAKTTTA